ncbi:MAG: L-lactate permease [Fimbriiglobus sp.]|jgi:lactate permease|nr:L-lactate permease [Fimbriiglobus sp.]
MLFADEPFTQNLVLNPQPTAYRVLSTFVAALPVLVLFYLLVRRRWLASWAGAAGSVVAVVLAVVAFGMPIEKAGMAWVYGACFGLLPIGWTVFGAMLIYNLTVETGMFNVIRRSIGGLSGDARVQAVLIGFCFGALMEGAAGSGAPVAICGAMLAGLGMPPMRAAVICLIANTSPVCYGGLGTPVFVLSGVTGISGEAISTMCGHQLPFLSFLVPLYMVKTFCTWRQTLAVWPALVVGGGSFALFQYLFATLHDWIPGVSVWPLTDVGASIFSMLSLAGFLKFVWKPKTEMQATEIGGGAGASRGGAHQPGQTSDPHAAEAMEQVEKLLGKGKGDTPDRPLTPGLVARAWSPFVVMSVCLGLIGVARQMETPEVEENGRRVKKSVPIDLGFAQSFYKIEVPFLHKQVERADRLQKPGATGDDRLEAAVFEFKWLTAAGTPCVAAVLISAFILWTSPAVLWRVLKKTMYQMRIPIPTIACMLGLSYVTKYAGMDAILGVAFAETGAFYPFFAALLGWLGVFLTGTDAGSNALFGSLQKITAGQIYEAGVLPGLDRGQAEVLICTANSTGGVMGKMIDAQSICVATAGTNQVGKEGDIFKAVIWHSVFLACVVGAMTALQAFIWPFTKMVPGQ